MKYIKHPKKPTTNSEKEDERRPWSLDRSKWSKLYSVQPSSSTSYTSAADISSASLLLNFSSGSTSSQSIFLNGNKQYANDQSNGQHSIYLQNNKPRTGYDSFALKQQQKTRFLLPPAKQSNHIHLNGNSTSLSNHHNGSPLKSAFNNADKSVEDQLNGQATASKQPAQDASSFKKLLPTNSLVARQPAASKPSLIRYTNGNNEQSKRQSRPVKVQITKENSTGELQDGEASQKKTVEPGKHLFVRIYLLMAMTTKQGNRTFSRLSLG